MLRHYPSNVWTDVMTSRIIDFVEVAEIRQLRESSVLSQEALARKLGVAVRTVARWESGVSKPSPLALEKLNRILVRQVKEPNLVGGR